MFVCVLVSVCICSSHDTYVVVTEQPGGVGYVFPLCVAKRPNSDLQDWQQEPLPAEPA